MKNFIFDVDGTLIDTMDMYMVPFQEILSQHGFSLSYEDVKPYFGITALDALRAVGVPDDQLDNINKEWVDTVYANQAPIKTFDGVDKMLATLKAQPGVNLIIATSKKRHEFETEFVPNFAIAQYFDASVTADETEHHKPAPDPVLAGIKKGNGIPADSIYIGDTINDLKATHAAGIKFGAALWGTAIADNLQAADYLLREPADLLKLI